MVRDDLVTIHLNHMAAAEGDRTRSTAVSHSGAFSLEASAQIASILSKECDVQCGDGVLVDSVTHISSLAWTLASHRCGAHLVWLDHTYFGGQSSFPQSPWKLKVLIHDLEPLSRFPLCVRSAGSSSTV
jgi:hypothetical protein